MAELNDELGLGNRQGVSNRQRVPGVTNEQRQNLARGLGTPTINAAQRSQAGRGSLGATLGDSSGTGANTQPRDQFLNRSSFQNQQNNLSNSQSFAEGQQEQKNTIEQVDRALRRGQISARDALKIRADAAQSLSGEGTRDFNVRQTAATATQRLGQEAVEGREDRLSRLRDTFARLDSAEGISAADRDSRLVEGQADRGLRRELGELDLTARALDRQQRAQESQAQLDQGERRINLTEQDQRNTQAFRTEQLGIDRGRLSENQRQFNVQERRLLENAGIDANTDQARLFLDLITSIPSPENEDRAALLELLGLGPRE